MGRKFLVLACLVASGCGESNDAAASGDSALVATNELSVKLGSAFACVLDPGQGVYCWGANGYGQLGQTPPKYGLAAGVHHSDVPVFIEGTQDAMSLSLGDSHACVLTPNDVLCWGADDSNQIGVSTAPDTCEGSATDSGLFDVACQPIPTSLGLGPKTWLSAGGEATCVGDGGGTTCIGGARYRLSSMSNLSSVAMSSESICGLDGSGKLKCDGSPSPDEYGAVQTLGIIESFVLGGGTNICAIIAGGALHCWGDRNSVGELGGGHTGIVNPWEGTIPLDSAVQVAAGDWHFCALSNTGVVHCWGRTSQGQVGIPPVVVPDVEMTDPESYELPEDVCPGGPCESAPVRVEGIGAAVSIAAHGGTSCAVTEDRQVKCWGRLVNSSVPTVIAGPWSK